MIARTIFCTIYTACKSTLAIETKEQTRNTTSSIVVCLYAVYVPRSRVYFGSEFVFTSSKWSTVLPFFFIINYTSKNEFKWSGK